MKKLSTIFIIVTVLLAFNITGDAPNINTVSTNQVTTESKEFLSELREKMNKQESSNEDAAATPYIEHTSNQEAAIYRTKTGSKYHKYGCKYLYKSCIETNMEYVTKKGLSPCSVCEP